MGQLRNSFCFQHQSNQLTVENAFRLKSVTQFLFLCLDLDCIIDVGLWANISFFPTPTGQFRLCFLSPMAKRVLNNISYYCFCYFFCLECLCSHCPHGKLLVIPLQLVQMLCFLCIYNYVHALESHQFLCRLSARVVYFLLCLLRKSSEYWIFLLYEIVSDIKWIL